MLLLFLAKYDKRQEVRKLLTNSEESQLQPSEKRRWALPNLYEDTLKRTGLLI